MDRLERNPDTPKGIPRARDIATTDMRNRAETMKHIREFFSGNSGSDEYFRSIKILPDKNSSLSLRVSMQHGTEIQLQIPSSEGLITTTGILPAQILVGSIGNVGNRKALGVMKTLQLEDLEEYLKLFAYLDKIGADARAKNRTLYFIPRSLSIVDETRLVYAQLGQVSLSPRDLMDVVEIFLYISSTKNPLPKKFEGERV